MSRIRMALMLAAMALTAISAFGVASAQAATEFENPGQKELTITATPDGTGTTAHHVFVTPAGSITCNALDLDGTTTTAATNATQTLKAEYTTCKFNGINTTVNMHSCDYNFNANGAVKVECTTAGDAITFEAAGCKVSVPAQSLTGITYANFGTAEITASTLVENIEGTAVGCPSGNGTFKTGKYTTGNTILTAVEKGTTTMKTIRVS